MKEIERRAVMRTARKNLKGTNLDTRIAARGKGSLKLPGVEGLKMIVYAQYQV